MRSINRKAIAATVFAGVLVVGGVTGVRFAAAEEVQFEQPNDDPSRPSQEFEQPNDDPSRPAPAASAVGIETGAPAVSIETGICWFNCENRE